MVLRSGIIIPFQFRDTKKLLMIGVPEENRNLNIWDLKNVVRAAFGIYNFEFRNKKIGFNIPDELLLHYLAQRHDLTNFVIEISQALDDGHAKELLSYEPSCSMAALKQQHQHQQQQQQQQQHHQQQQQQQQQHHAASHAPHQVPLPQRSNDSVSHTHDYGASGSAGASTLPGSQPVSPALRVCNEPGDSPLEQTNNSSSDHVDATQKLRLTQTYAERTPESLTQSIDPMDIIPKAESETDAERMARVVRFQAREQQRQQQEQQHAQALQQEAQALQHVLPGQQFFSNYAHSLPTMTPPNASSQPPYTSGLMSRFRMYDAALENYVLHPQCRCGAQKLLSDSPTPEEPTNLCQSNSVIDAATSTAALAQLPHCDDDEQESMKYRIDKASSGAASAELVGMPAYEPCSPKMDYETQDELPDSPHSQQQLQQQLPTPTIALPPPPTHHQHQHQHHHHDDDEEEQQQQQQQQLLQERIQHEFMLQQQHQHQHLQQQQQQHLALLQQQQHEAQQQHQQQQHSHQHQQLPPQQQQQQGVNMAITATGTNSIRQRKERMSKRQKELYVHFLQQHQFINDHRRNDPVLDPYWLKLANLLNAVPQGAVKHVTEWKQTFDNWRYRIFLYARYNSKLQDEEAQNPRNFKPLTRTDKQAYNMWIRNPDTAPPDLDKMRNVFCNMEESTAHQD